MSFFKFLGTYGLPGVVFVHDLELYTTQPLLPRFQCSEDVSVERKRTEGVASHLSSPTRMDAVTVSTTLVGQ